MLSGLFGHWDVCPAMPCVEVVDYGHIRPGEVSGFGATPCSSPVGISVLQYANVTKLLDRKEHYRDPKAREAIRQEGESLVRRVPVCGFFLSPLPSVCRLSTQLS